MRNERKIKIQDVDFIYDEDQQYEKDGHVYCKTCHEQIDGKLMELLNTKMILRSDCRCVRERREKEKIFEEKIRIERMKDMCFLVPHQKEYTLENCFNKSSKAYKAAKSYVKNFEKMRDDNVGILFYGTVGSGKSYLACAIANAVIETYKISVKMRNFAQILGDLQKGGFEMDRNQYIENLTNTSLLILDDLGMERNTSYALEQVYNVINSRSLKKKPTIITTNLSLEAIRNTSESVEYQRIYSRVLEMCIPIMVVGEDYRKRIHKEKINKAKQVLLREEVER